MKREHVFGPKKGFSNPGMLEEKYKKAWIVNSSFRKVVKVAKI